MLVSRNCPMTWLPTVQDSWSWSEDSVWPYSLLSPPEYAQHWVFMLSPMFQWYLYNVFFFPDLLLCLRSWLLYCLLCALLLCRVWGEPVSLMRMTTVIPLERETAELAKPACLGKVKVFPCHWQMSCISGCRSALLSLKQGWRGEKTHAHTHWQAHWKNHPLLHPEIQYSG